MMRPYSPPNQPRPGGESSLDVTRRGGFTLRDLISRPMTRRHDRPIRDKMPQDEAASPIYASPDGAARQASYTTTQGGEPIQANPCRHGTGRQIATRPDAIIPGGDSRHPESAPITRPAVRWPRLHEGDAYGL